MSKQVWKAGTLVYPAPVVMVSCGTLDGIKNIITVAWTGTVNTNPAMTYISLRPERYSYNIIKQTGEFVINLTTKNLVKACDFCGVKSGADVDKFSQMNLTAAPSAKLSAPIIYESPVNIECKVKEIIPLGSHHMFLAEVMAVDVSDEYFDKTGKFHFNKSNPVCYSHGEYFALGEKLGSFGYSIRKKPVEKKQKNTYHKPNKTKNKYKRK